MTTGTTTDKSNRVNGINIDVLGKTVNDIKNDPEMGQCRFRATNKWVEANHNCTAVTGFYGAKQEFDHKQKFELHADEPPILAGQDEFPNPVENLLNVLLDAGWPNEAEVVYAADLRKNPENGFSLFGLQVALERQDKLEDAPAVAVRFERAWAAATHKLTSSRF